MKSIFTLIFTLTIITASFAQWEALHFAEGVPFPDIEGIYALESHDGALYGSSEGKRIQKSTDQGATWTAIPVFMYPGKIIQLTSAGDRLYACSESSFAEGKIYYTEDDGMNWVLDTVGMPTHIFYAESKSFVREIIYCGEHLVATFDNVDAFYIKRPTDAAWVKSDFLAQNDPRNYACINGSTLIAAADDKFYFNEDLDGEFTIPANSNLINYWTGDVAASNGSRIFLAGKSFNAPMQELYYSDDMGENWSSIDVSNILSENVFSGTQSIVAIHAVGNEVYLALNQDATDSPADVYYSNDGGLTYVKFSAGLPDDANGTDYFKKFISHENSVYALANFKDLYRNGGVINSTSITPKNILNLYPNPTQGIIEFSSSEDFGRVNIYNAWGKLIIRDAKKQIDLSAYAPGIYFAHAAVGGVAKIIKQ